MDWVTGVVGGAEVTGAVVVFLLLAVRQIRQGARDAWREEAEAQTAKATRLSDDVAELVREVRLLRDENAALRREVRELRAENRELREQIDTLLDI